jgi:endonuclease/exonuclease/phosphatase family metal-dependent hydrolase
MTGTSPLLPIIGFPAVGLAVVGLAFAGLCAREPSAAGLSPSGHPPIVIDGIFEDWVGLPIAVDDPPDAPVSAVDLGRIKGGHDDGAIYLLIDLGRPVNVEALPGTISLIFDEDADPKTGWAEAGLDGADLVIDLSPPYRVGNVPPRIGVGVRVAATPGASDEAGLPPAPFEPRDSYDVGFVHSPKFRSRLIELRLERLSASGAGGRFANEEYAAKVVFKGPDGELLDEAGPFAYRLSPRRPRPPAMSETLDPLARPAGTSLRVMSWNVSGRNLLERSERFRRIISAVRPDLLLLDEVSAGLSSEAIRALLPDGGEAGADEWEVLYGEAGGRQRGVIAARGGRLWRVPPLERVDYPAELTTKLMGARPPGFGGVHDGVPTLGVVVEISGARLLASTSDLQCCGNGLDTPEEMIRVAEAETIGDSIRRALSANADGVDGVIVAGDFNLISSRQPLVLLSSGLDRDGSDLAVSHPLDLGGLADATWSGARAARAFAPGRLDFLSYSDSSLRLERAFVLSTSSLPAAWLEAHGLEADDSVHASDHYPIVADLSWIEPEEGGP